YTPTGSIKYGCGETWMSAKMPPANPRRLAADVYAQILAYVPRETVCRRGGGQRRRAGGDVRAARSGDPESARSRRRDLGVRAAASECDEGIAITKTVLRI